MNLFKTIALEDGVCVCHGVVELLNYIEIERKGKDMLYLTTHSTHFIYGYMASDIL